MTLFGAIILVLAGLLWLASIANLATINNSDAAGNALSYAFGVFMLIGVWIFLAVLLLIAGTHGEMPTWAKVAALLLHPLSGAASVSAVELLKDRHTREKFPWPAGIPAITAPLIMAYAVWTYLPNLRALASPDIVGSIVWGVVFVISLTPWPTLLKRQRVGAVNRAEVQAAYEAQQARDAEQKRQENLAKFQKFNQETHLWEWLNLTRDGNELREQAFAGIRTLARRQADAEEMIERGLDLPTLELHHLNLAPTPRLFELTLKFLHNDAEAFRDRAKDAPSFGVVAQRMERHFLAMHWLRINGCDIEPALAAYEAAAKMFPDSPERVRYLAQLARLR